MLFRVPRRWVHIYIFPLATLLAIGKGCPSPSLSLGSLYDRLEEYAHNIFPSFGRYNVVIYIDTEFLQMFLWERFVVLSPKPVEFDAIEPEVVVVQG